MAQGSEGVPPMTHKVLVCGGRNYDDWVRVDSVLDRIHRVRRITHLIHGDAPGADRLGGSWARKRSVQVVACPANWSSYGNGAGPIRNERMAELGPDLVVAFPGGTGTASMRLIAEAAGIPVEVIS